MKLFSINAMFVLPDDFTGNETDAMRLAADHINASKDKTLSEPKLAPTVQDIASEMPRVIDSGHKFYGGVSLSEGDFQNGWKTLNQ